jgi:hypothetical protein
MLALRLLLSEAAAGKPTQTAILSQLYLSSATANERPDGRVVKM